MNEGWLVQSKSRHICRDHPQDANFCQCEKDVGGALLFVCKIPHAKRHLLPLNAVMMMSLLQLKLLFR
jgi:hypothetical protein